jgi:uncharacterized membrane protein
VRFDERGQTTVLVVGMSMVVFAVAGLAVDGTKAFLMRRTLQSAADAAALAGAGELDQGLLYSSGGRRLRLDPLSARLTAIRFLELRGLPGRADVSTTGERVVVRLRSEVSTSFLRIIGVGKLPVAVEAGSAPAVDP